TTASPCTVGSWSATWQNTERVPLPHRVGVARLPRRRGGPRARAPGAGSGRGGAQGGAPPRLLPADHELPVLRARAPRRAARRRDGVPGAPPPRRARHRVAVLPPPEGDGV